MNFYSKSIRLFLIGFIFFLHYFFIKILIFFRFLAIFLHILFFFLFVAMYFYALIYKTLSNLMTYFKTQALPFFCHIFYCTFLDPSTRSLTLTAQDDRNGLGMTFVGFLINFIKSLILFDKKLVF